MPFSQLIWNFAALRTEMETSTRGDRNVDSKYVCYSIPGDSAIKNMVTFK